MDTKKYTITALFCVISLQIFDMLSTYYLINYCDMIEANCMVDTFISYFGLWPGLILSKLALAGTGLTVLMIYIKKRINLNLILTGIGLYYIYFMIFFNLRYLSINIS